MPKKKGRKPTLKSLRNKSDKLLQATFMEKAENKYCEGQRTVLVDGVKVSKGYRSCGKPAVCGHHFWTKANSAALRYEHDNLVAVCAGCHLRHHQGAPELHVGVIERRGIEWFKALELKKNTTIVKPSAKYYNEILLCLSQTKLQ